MHAWLIIWKEIVLKMRVERGPNQHLQVVSHVLQYWRERNCPAELVGAYPRQPLTSILGVHKIARLAQFAGMVLCKHAGTYLAVFKKRARNIDS